jgi:cell wall-associated NlpC family hydrolase
MMKKLLVALVTAAVAFGTISVSAPADATTKRVTAWNFAKSQAGKPYCYGGEGSRTRSASCYDCSGLTYTAYLHAGISLPRTADAQRRSSKVVHISKANARTGDLVFWGYGHVEFVYRDSNGKVWRFGAHHSGTRISKESLYGSPAFYHVRNSG